MAMARAAPLQRVFLLTFVAGFVLLTGPVHAAGDRRSLEQAVHGPSADQCPLPSAVASETWKLTPADRRDVFERLTDVVIEDLGSSYRVVVTTPDGTTTRTYPGPDRDCARRARFAAVFIVLTLMPPDVPPPEALPEPPPLVVAPAPVPPEPVRSSPTPPVVRLELMATADQGLHLGRANAVLCRGARLQTLLGSGTFAPAFGIGYAPPVRFDVGPVRAEIARATTMAGLRARRGVGAFEVGAETAALVILSRVAGTNLAHPASDSGLELGAEISVTAAWRAGTLLQPFIGLEVQWIPIPRALIALPRGDLGTLPPLWLGASAGVALSL